jgi:NTE family protein
VLAERGFRIRSIAGSSMGALVGGIHAAGKLKRYKGVSPRSSPTC